MTDYTPFVKSHPSARVRRLLASAELDVPPAGGRERTLVAVSHVDPRVSTTNFSGIALGTTVHRLIGAVTLYGSKASPFRLVLRGSAVGAAAGALALAAIVTLRWTQAPGTTAANQAITDAPASPATAQQSPATPSELESLRAAELDLEATHAESALARARAFLTDYPGSSLRAQAIVLEVKALVRLGRLAEAQAAANSILSAGPSAAATQLRELLRDPQRGTLPSEPMK